MVEFQHWLDPKKQVCRQIRGISPFTLYLGVKFYAADPCRLVEEITRYQFFLQVKQDVLQGRLPVNPDLAVELAALALQCKNRRIFIFSYTVELEKWKSFKIDCPAEQECCCLASGRTGDGRTFPIRIGNNAKLFFKLLQQNHFSIK